MCHLVNAGRSAPRRATTAVIFTTGASHHNETCKAVTLLFFFPLLWGMRCIFSSAPSVHVGQVPTSAHDKLSILKWHPAGGGGSGVWCWWWWLGGVGAGIYKASQAICSKKNPTVYSFLRFRYRPGQRFVCQPADWFAKPLTLHQEKFLSNQ